MQQRFARFPRVAHGLKRLVVIGSDGVVSLSALRWLADQGDTKRTVLLHIGVLGTTCPYSFRNLTYSEFQNIGKFSVAVFRLLQNHLVLLLIRQTQCSTISMRYWNRRRGSQLQRSALIPESEFFTVTRAQGRGQAYERAAIFFIQTSCVPEPIRPHTEELPTSPSLPAQNHLSEVEINALCV